MQAPRTLGRPRCGRVTRPDVARFLVLTTIHAAIPRHATTMLANRAIDTGACARQGDEADAIIGRRRRRPSFRSELV